MARILGVTGTPGTGKKSIAPRLASKLGVQCVGLGALVSAGGVGKEEEVDTDKLRALMSRTLAGKPVVFGHLVPYVLERSLVERVVVLRCEPAVLKKRLAKRGYPPRKTVENVEAELIGLLAADSRTAFGSRKVLEFDTTKTNPIRAAAALRVLLERGEKMAGIDWASRYDSARKLRSLLSAPSPQTAHT